MTSKRLVSFFLGAWWGACFVGPIAWAQAATNGLDNLDWKEEAAPPPPAFSKDRMIPLEMPRHITLKVGVDPETITVGADGVVRYAVVMVNSTGSVNAVFEGIRCASDEFKIYARAGSSGTWNLVTDPQWKPVTDNMPSRHAMVFARQAACDVRVTNTKAEILRRLKQGANAGSPKPVIWQ